MKNKKFILSLLFLGSLFLITNLVVAETGCCERTLGGAICQDVDRAWCGDGSRFVLSKCSATSFCKLGTCYDGEEGVCMENTPIDLCKSGGGEYFDKPAVQIEKCQLGCCVLGEQAQFVTTQRCKKLSEITGREMEFRDDYTSEGECLLSSRGSEVGACVFEEEFTKTCKFTTREECLAGNEDVEVVNGSVNYMVFMGITYVLLLN